MGDATSLWSKAQGAFGNGNLDEAVKAAKAAKARLDALAATLKVDSAGAGFRLMKVLAACLERQRAFAHDDRVAADVRGDQASLVDFELDADPSRPLHLPALVTDKAG